MRCPNCKNEMKNVMHFENDKNFAFHECKKCHTRTHKKRIHFDEFEKKEGKNNEAHIYKRKVN